MSDALVFQGVVKTFGPARALDGLDFRVPTGSVCGFVGPNGAGKTTAFSVVSGFLPPDDGTVDILGTGGFDPWTLKGRLGVLPQDAELPDRHTPRELLRHLGRLQGLSRAEAVREADAKLALVGLGDRADHAIRTLSHGMRRRVAVASALVGDPELVLLDEPLAGLDPVQARALRDALAALRGIRTLVVSSHDLHELERLCDWVVMLDHGRCVQQGTIAAVTGRAERVVFELGGPIFDPAPLAARLPDHGVSVEGTALRVTVPAGGDLDQATLVVMESLLAARVPIHGVRRGTSLEDAFVAQRSGDRV